MIPKRLNQCLTTGFILGSIRIAGRASQRYVEECNRQERMSPELQQADQLRRLKRVVQHAAGSSRFYGDQFRETLSDLNDLQSIADLQQLPILEKDQLRGIPASDFLTRRSFGLRSSSTTGSTGQPTRVFFDTTWWARSIARRSRLFARHGLVFGSREGRLWGRGHTSNRNQLAEILGHRRLFQFVAQAVESRDDELRELIKYDPDYLYGYSSLILKATRAVEAHGARPGSIKGVVRTAETMNEHQVEHVARVFGCPVINEYGCSEVEIMGFDCEHGACHVETPHVILEAVPANDGITETVVTDLDNDVMPIIRYRVGDVISLEPSACPCGRTSPVITSIAGRTTNRIIRLPNGREEHAVMFAHIVEQLHSQGYEIAQFRVIQLTLQSFRFVLDGVPESQHRRLSHLVAETVASRLGADITTEVRFEDIDLVRGKKHTYFEPLAEDTLISRHPASE